MLNVNPLATVNDAPGFRRMFRAGRLTLGVFFPIEAFQGDEPSMQGQERLAQRAFKGERFRRFLENYRE